jgi:prepilin-type N-terminal cleavage/methylation domain-containing protein
MRSIRPDDGGFTLIEVLIAIFILAVGLLSLITMQITGIKGNATASRISEASGFSADRIEELFTLDWDHADLTDDTAPNGSAGLDETGATADGSMVSPDGLYTIYWNIADDTPMPDTKKIRVIIIQNQISSAAPVIMDYLKTKQI